MKSLKKKKKRERERYEGQTFREIPLDLNLYTGDVFDIPISFNLIRHHDIMSQIPRMKIIIITIATIY